MKTVKDLENLELKKEQNKINRKFGGFINGFMR